MSNDRNSERSDSEFDERNGKNFQNVPREASKSNSEERAGGNGVESEKNSQRTLEDSQEDSSWKTIERSQDNSASGRSESLLERVVTEQESGRDVTDYYNPQTSWTFTVGTCDNLLKNLNRKYLWKSEKKDSKILRKMNERSCGSDQGTSGELDTSGKLKNHDSPPRVPTFNSLALDVSYAGLDTSGFLDLESSRKSHDDDPPEVWEDFSVVECLDRKLLNDESTPEERVEALKEILADTDIHEGDGIVSDFLFHVAKTKHGKIYIRVIRTMLINRGRI